MLETIDRAIKLFGVHGTTQSAATTIKEHGFTPSKEGYAGQGAYFWRYFNNANYAKHLAFHWWRNAYQRGDYHAHPHDNCCLIEVEITCTSLEHIFDISSGEERDFVREKLTQKIRALQQYQNLHRHKNNAKDVMVSQFFEMVYKQADTDIQAVITTLPIPRKTPLQASRYMGNSAETIMVRDCSSINILNCWSLDANYATNPNEERVDDYATIY